MAWLSSGTRSRRREERGSGVREERWWGRGCRWQQNQRGRSVEAVAVVWERGGRGGVVVVGNKIKERGDGGKRAVDVAVV